MAEREIAGEAEQDVESEREDGPDHDLGRQRLIAVDPDDPPRHRQHDAAESGEHDKVPAGNQLGQAGARTGPAGPRFGTADPAPSKTPSFPHPTPGRPSATNTATTHHQILTLD